MPTLEFVKEADYVLGEILAYMNMFDRAIADEAIYYVADKPSDWQLKATGTPGGYKLLGMYEYQPTHKITIFEDSIRWLATKMGSTYMAIRDILEHEIYQHALGLDHVKETIAEGLVPAYALPCG